MQMTPIVVTGHHHHRLMRRNTKTGKEDAPRTQCNERTKIARSATVARSAVQLLPDLTCEGDGVGADRARCGQRVPVLAVARRVPEERQLLLGLGGDQGQEAEAAAAAGVGEGDVERGRERGEEVEQRQAQQLGLQHRGAPHAHRPPHASHGGGSGRAAVAGPWLPLGSGGHR